MNLLVYDTLFHSAVCGACLQACGTRGKVGESETAETVHSAGSRSSQGHTNWFITY